MRLWKKSAGLAPVAPVLLQSDDQRFVAEAAAERAQVKAAFDVSVARMARHAATPALGKGTPPASRAGY